MLIRRVNGFGVSILFAVTVSVSLSGQAQAAGFAFEKVVDNNGSLGSFGLPDINDSGQIAFTAEDAGGESGLYIYSPGGSAQLVTDTSGDLTGFDSFVSISNSGTAVAWANTDSGEQRIFTGTDDGSTQTVAETNGNFQSLTGGASISSDDTVAFRGENSSGDEGIYTRQGSDPVQTVEDETGSFEAFFAPFINQQGDMSYFARYNDGYAAVFNDQDNGTRVEVLDDTGDYSGILPYSAPNSHGQVAIRGVRDDGTGDEIVLTDGTSTDVLASTGDEFYSLVTDLALNDNGLVAFNPRMDDDGGPGDLALYFSDGDDVHRVIGPGDNLFGSTVRDIFFTHGLNESNELAFAYTLDNDEHGIATTTVPEPTSAALLLLSTTLLLRRRRSA